MEVGSRGCLFSAMLKLANSSPLVRKSRVREARGVETFLINIFSTMEICELSHADVFPVLKKKGNGIMAVHCLIIINLFFFFFHSLLELGLKRGILKNKKIVIEHYILIPHFFLEKGEGSRTTSFLPPFFGKREK